MMIFLLLVNLFIGSSLAKLPTMNCQFPSPNLVACVQREIFFFLPKIILDGVPELDIKPLNPMSIPTITSHVGSGPFKATIEMMNSTVKGLQETQFKDIRITKFKPPNDIEMTVTTLHPKLEMDGHYNEKIFNINEGGAYTMYVSNLEAVTKVWARFETRFGRTFLVVDKVNLAVTIGDMKISIPSKEKSVFASPTLAMINKFWPAIHKETWPHVQPQIEQIIKDHINDITRNLPLEEVFTNSENA